MAAPASSCNPVAAQRGIPPDADPPGSGRLSLADGSRVYYDGSPCGQLMDQNTIVLRLEAHRLLPDPDPARRFDRASHSASENGRQGARFTPSIILISFCNIRQALRNARLFLQASDEEFLEEGDEVQEEGENCCQGQAG